MGPSRVVHYLVMAVVVVACNVNADGGKEGSKELIDGLNAESKAVLETKQKGFEDLRKELNEAESNVDEKQWLSDVDRYCASEKHPRENQIMRHWSCAGLM